MKSYKKYDVSLTEKLCKDDITFESRLCRLEDIYRLSTQLESSIRTEMNLNRYNFQKTRKNESVNTVYFMYDIYILSSDV